MNELIPHRKSLPEAQRHLWPQLRATADLGLVLYGGTAIALRLGHRPSLDFDFFTEKPLDREALKANFPFIAHSTIVQDRKNTFSALAPVDNDSVKVSFFGGIDFGRVGYPERTVDGVAEVASLLDLLATKLKTMQRIESKDYMDVAAILRAGISLEDGLSAAAALFGSDFQPSEAIRPLTFFQGGDLASLSQFHREVLIHAATHVRSIPLSVVTSRSLSSRS